MGAWSLGSVTDAVQNLIDDIPTALSGTRMLEMADRQRQFVEDYTGVVIGSNGIGIKYQDVVFKLTAAESLKLMNTIGADATGYSIGPLNVEKGGESNLLVSAQRLKDDAMEQLKYLGRALNFKKVNS